MKRALIVMAFVLIAVFSVAFIVGCGSDSGGGGVNPFKTPTAADKYEGSTGDNTPATASSISVGGQQIRTHYPAGDVDWVKVSLINDVTYEFSANRLSLNSDTILYLFWYEDVAAPVVYSDDYINYDSSFTYTPTTAGDYYLLVRGYSSSSADPTSPHTYENTYTLGVRKFVDADGDEYSDYYDCNDNDDTIYPWADEISGDGIDQNCDGIDTPATAADRFEADDTFDKARTIVEDIGETWEYIYRLPETAGNTRTIYNADGAPVDEDWFKLTVPAYGAYEVGQRWTVADYSDNGVNVDTELYASDGLTSVGTDWYENTTDAAQTIYIKVFAATSTNMGAYNLYAASYGTDADQDGYYTLDWDYRDCNDADDTINPDAMETDGDGIDSNCDGYDDAP